MPRARDAGSLWIDPLGRPAPYSDPPDKGQETPLRPSHPGVAWEKSPRLGYKSAAMTPTTVAAVPDAARDFRVISLVCAAHFVSHFYILVLPPLFPLVHAEFWRELHGARIALIAFNVTTARARRRPGSWSTGSGRAVLVAGLVLGAACLAIVSLVRSSGCWSRCSRCLASPNGSTIRPTTRCSPTGFRSAQPTAYSLTYFAGFLGTAVAPPACCFLQPRSAGGRVPGRLRAGPLVAIALMLATGGALAERCTARRTGRRAPAGEGKADGGRCSCRRRSC